MSVMRDLFYVIAIIGLPLAWFTFLRYLGISVF